MTAGADVTADVLVIGAGLAGSAAALPLARTGARVVVLDADPDQPRPDRPSARGGLVFSRGAHTLNELGVTDDRLGRVVTHVRLRGEHELSRPLPTLGGVPNRVVDESVLKSVLRERLVSALPVGSGELWSGWSAHAPIVERGFLRGAVATDADGRRREVRADYTVIADGANSTFGRTLGTFRRRTWPLAVSAGSVWPSPRSDDDQVEVALNLVDRAGTAVTGFGWVLPRGDGTVGVGVTVLSTTPSFQVLSAERLLDAFVERCRAAWKLGQHPAIATIEGRQPLGNSIAPVSGPTYLVAGDAGGFGNPMIGTGTDTALASGRAAGDVITQALADGSSAPLQRYARAVNDRTAGLYKVGRLAARLLGRPTLMERFADTVTRSPAAADIFVRIAIGELRARRLGSAELVYRVAQAASVFAPEA